MKPQDVNNPDSKGRRNAVSSKFLDTPSYPLEVCHPTNGITEVGIYLCFCPFSSGLACYLQGLIMGILSEFFIYDPRSS